MPDDNDTAPKPEDHAAMMARLREFLFIVNVEYGGDLSKLGLENLTPEGLADLDKLINKAILSASKLRQAMAEEIGKRNSYRKRQ
jgi:hypothetical protein